VNARANKPVSWSLPKLNDAEGNITEMFISFSIIYRRRWACWKNTWF
jgi:hypothetical protein